MRSVISVSFPAELAGELEKMVREKGRTKSSIIKEALRAYLWEEKFNDIRKRIAPKARSKGWVIDEDVFKDIS